jgi:ferredoxin
MMLGFTRFQEATMTYVVTEHCLKCKYTDCAEVCPVEAFHEGPEMLYINPSTCIDCNLCVAECPVDAIYAEDEVPKKYQSFTKLNADECEKYPTIAVKKDPLPGALTREQWKEKDAASSGAG